MSNPTHRMEPTCVLNGRWLQLWLHPAPGRGAPGIELVRKRDQRRLWRWPVPPKQPAQPRPRLLRREQTELTALLSLAAAPPRTGQAGTRLAQTAFDASAALRRLGLPPDSADQQRLPLYPEPPRLLVCGHDSAGRRLLLEPACARAWQRLQRAASDDGIRVLPVSGYRSLDYQTGLVARKLARGMMLAEILRYSALPGRSEHHLGTVLDLHDGNGPALEETFETSAAFAWLQENAARFGFRLSYPRDNPWQVAYEPWHWRYLPQATAA